MTGYNEIVRLRRIEKELDELGLKLAQPKDGWNTADLNYIAVVPKDTDSLPIYSRDAQLFLGSLEELNVWLRGVEWARQYDDLLKVSSKEKRERKEQNVRNMQMVALLRDEKLVLKK